MLGTHTPELFRAAAEQAVQLLREGEVVALPTETVYGLAANAFDEKAVSRIFQIKGRPPSNPIIVHVASEEMARQCVKAWPELAAKLARAFWPGPLTMVLERSERIPSIVTAGGETVGVRWPAHPLIQEVIRECGFPLAAPSANLSNRTSPTTAQHVAETLGDKIALIVDGGPAQVGIESTVLDLTERPPRVLRPGMIHEGALLALIGQLDSGTRAGQAVSRSPGQLPTHYSPRAKLVVWQWANEAELKTRAQALGAPLPRIHVIAHSSIPGLGQFGRVSVIPEDAEAFGRALYAELHQCDAEGADWIIVQALPSGVEWRAIADRLERAAAK